MFLPVPVSRANWFTLEIHHFVNHFSHADHHIRRGSIRVRHERCKRAPVIVDKLNVTTTDMGCTAINRKGVGLDPQSVLCDEQNMYLSEGKRHGEHRCKRCTASFNTYGP